MNTEFIQRDEMLDVDRETIITIGYYTKYANSSGEKYV